LLTVEWQSTINNQQSWPATILFSHNHNQTIKDWFRLISLWIRLFFDYFGDCSGNVKYCEHWIEAESQSIRESTSEHVWTKLFVHFAPTSGISRALHLWCFQDHFLRVDINLISQFLCFYEIRTWDEEKDIVKQKIKLQNRSSIR
jgi:hypothetical protein